MDTCPNCGAKLSAYLVEAMNDPNETWARCPHDKSEITDLDRIVWMKHELRALPEGPAEISQDLQESMDWFYGRLWNVIFEDEPEKQVPVPPVPRNKVSWEEFNAGMDELFPDINLDDLQHTDSNKENI